MAEETTDLEEIAVPGNNKMMMIVVAINLIAVLGIGGFVVFGNSSDAGASPAPSAAEIDPSAPPVLVGLAPFIVNLKEPGGTRYLKMVIEIEVLGSKGSAHINSRIAPVRHQIISSLSELTFSDTQGANKKKTIRTNLVKRINETLKNDIAQDVYFTEFVIQ